MRPLSCATALVGACMLLHAAGAAQAARPNVVLLVTDDQGYGDLSCNGNPVLKTPNLDRLHDEGVHLEDFVITSYSIHYTKLYEHLRHAGRR